MNIAPYIDEFIKKNHRYRPYSKICRNLLTGGKKYSLNAQAGYEESEYLPYNIKSSVQAYSSNKDMAIAMYKDFVKYLGEQGVKVPEISFPPVPVSNTFERLMFIAKYLQEEEHRISDLVDVLWISSRTVEEDISRLRGSVDPIQVCGRKFTIPDTERQDGRLHFQSTAHPLFLAENLTQILITLKGLKAMAENPLYEPYARQSAREIWQQLSPYARRRLRFVLSELMPEDFAWYEELDERREDDWFHTEEACSRVSGEGPSVLMECIKNGKTFCVEYEEEDGIRLYKECVMEEKGYRGDGIVVNCSGGRKLLRIDRVIRSAYSIEELAAD